MKNFKKLFENQTIRFQLTFWFLFISLIPLAWVTFITFNTSKDVILKETQKRLHATGLKQINLLNAFFAEKEKSAAAIAEELIQPETEALLDLALRKYGKESKEYKQALSQIEPQLIKRSNSLNYQNFMLVDDDGSVVLSLNKELLEPGSNLLNSSHSSHQIFSALFKRTLSTLKPQLSPLSFFTAESTPSIFLSTPLTNTNGQLFGILIFQIKNSAMYSLLENFSGIGETGETLIAFNLNSNLVVFSSFTHKNIYPHIYRLNPNSPFGIFITEVLTGGPKIDYVQDYHGNTTIAVGKKINPYTNWAIITKINRDELLSTIDILKYLAWAVLITTAVIVLIIATYVARKISDPILLLTQKTKLMSAGDLKQRIELPYKNELGNLGESFNEMASQLSHIIQHLDTLVDKRTKEIEDKNAQLNEIIRKLKETQNRMLMQEKLASLGSLTAGIAHEIKNPLNFINNFTELSFEIEKNLNEQLEKVRSLIPNETLEEIKEELHTLKSNLEKIYKHGKRADSIVYNMLQHSRAVPGEKIEINLNKLLDEYVDLAFHGVRAKNPSFKTAIIKNYDSELPLIKVSPQEISRVFLNLLNNAFYSLCSKEKSSQKNYQPRLEVTTKNLDNEISIEFKDNGLGMDKDVLDKLFTPFFTTKPAGEGTGLGLSLSYQIISQGHNGVLKAESQPGESATFTILLPKKYLN